MRKKRAAARRIPHRRRLTVALGACVLAAAASPAAARRPAGPVDQAAGPVDLPASPDMQVRPDLPVRPTSKPPYDGPHAGGGGDGEGELPFTPGLSLSTSTTTAAGHPALTVEMHKPMNYCLEPAEPSLTAPCRKLYMQQNLKKMATRLPAGLVADANAAPDCDPYTVEGGPSNADQAWLCRNRDARVGTVQLVAEFCDLALVTNAAPSGCWGDPVIPPVGFLHAPGIVYMDYPRPGEVGHLIILWPQLQIDRAAPLRTDVSVTLRPEDLGIDAVADDIPDVLPMGNGILPGQVTDLALTLDGSTGEASGHPLLANPTLCDGQTIDVEFGGYLHNSVPTVDESSGEMTGAIPGYGDGKTVAASAPYRATGCDAAPYDPRLSLGLESAGPDQAPAISFVVSQAPVGEATTREVRVRFPRRFKVNAKSMATHCPDDLLDASERDAEDRCPESSRIGTVTAESRLLPQGQSLSGNVYLAGLTSDSVKISAFIRGRADPARGFIDLDLRIDGQGSIGEDLVLETVFSDLPPMPMTRFDLGLFGGEKGLVRTPRLCSGQPEEIVAEFTSHSGKTKVNTVPVRIEGCPGPELSAELSNRHAGEATNLDLSVSSAGTPLRHVDFRIDRHMRFGLRKGGSGRLRSMGRVEISGPEARFANRLKARGTRYGNVRLLPVIRRTKQGALTAAQAPDFRATLFRSRRGAASAAGWPQGAAAAGFEGAARRRPNRRREVANDLAVRGGLDGRDDLTSIELSLLGGSKSRRFFLNNPSRCRKPLSFVAVATARDGTRYALKDRVRLRGRRCR